MSNILYVKNFKIILNMILKIEVVSSVTFWTFRARIQAEKYEVKS